MITFLSLLVLSSAENYEESLYLEPLTSERVLTQITFNFEAENEPIHNYRRYPRLVDEITSKLGVIELGQDFINFPEV